MLLFLFQNNVNSQFRLDKHDDILSFSFIYEKVDRLKANGRINSIDLPSCNNDSLFWLYNFNTSNPGRLSECVATGFYIDTSIVFFESATRIKIPEGFLWLLKITSPSAHRLGITLNHFEIDSLSYLSSHSNVNGYGYHHPLVLSCKDLKDKKRGYSKTHRGNIYYLEVFSPSKEIERIPIEIISILYEYPVNYRLSDAPPWIREKYPEVDF
mgnify:CR=1 FL=1